MKKTSILFILAMLFFINCSEDNNDNPVGEEDGETELLPKSGEWNASCEFGTFDLFVNSARTHITKVAFLFSEWSCGGITRSGGMSIESDPGYAITERQFSVSIDLNPSPFYKEMLNITGEFNKQGDEASGSWEAEVNSETCSGTWEAAPAS